MAPGASAAVLLCKLLTRRLTRPPPPEQFIVPVRLALPLHHRLERRCSRRHPSTHAWNLFLHGSVQLGSKGLDLNGQLNGVLVLCGGSSRSRPVHTNLC